MKKLILVFTMCFFALGAFANEVNNLSSDEAMLKLTEGNARFATRHLKHPDISKRRQGEMLKGQHPYVAILSCSDSRVPPEIIFDQGLGDIFEIRNAGNVLDTHIIGSIEYAVVHLGVKLVVIMGHQDCGVINAAMSGGKESEFIESLKKPIANAIEECKKQNMLTPDNVVKVHVKNEVKSLLQQDRELNEYVKKHNVKIIPAFYHLDSGKVEFLD